MTVQIKRAKGSRSNQGAVLLVGAIALALSGWSCTGGGEGADESATTQVRSELGTCTSSTVKVVDLQADFRDIWKGRETADTGKQSDPTLKVGVAFNTTVVPAQVTAQFVPVKTDGTCGPTVSATLASSLTASQAWGTVTTNVARAPLPSAFNALVRDGITGIVSAGGPIAAGGDVVLSSMTVNGTARQPVGLIAGGKVVVSSGSVFGNVTYGVASTIPQTVSVSGTKTLQPFATTAAFQDLTSLSVLLAELAPTGTATTSNGTLQMTGNKTTLNVFQVSADALSLASTVLLNVPASSATLVNVTGNMSVSVLNKGISVQGATAATLLWNIPSAAFVRIAGVSLPGSILAPRSLVTFESGSLNGTLVAMAFASPGSGTLQHTPLNVTKLFPAATTPSLVRLTPAQPLVRGCSYQFVVPDTVPLTSGNACLSPPIGVTFRVAGASSTPAGRELVNVEPDPVLRTMRRFTARPGINTLVDDVWSRYESAIGIPVSNLVPTTVTTPSSTRPGQTVTVYQQYAQGYPVVGYGYFVATQGALFRAASGKVFPNLPTFAAPTVTAAVALQNALTFMKITPGQAPWITNPTANKAPVGRLVVAAKRLFPARTDFVLAWDFRLGRGTGIIDPGGIQVDAATGAVLAVDPGRESIAYLNSGATHVATQSATVDTLYDGNGRTFDTASYRNPDTSIVTTLATGKIGVDGVLATAIGVTEDSRGNPVGTAQYVVDATPLTPWTEAVERRMATLQWALTSSNTFMKDLNLNIAGAPWKFIDGVGHQRVMLNYSDSPPVAGIDSAHYSYASTPDVAQIFVYRAPPIVPLQAGTVAHEYAHALVHNLRRSAGFSGNNQGVATLANYGESGSISEGVADLFMAAFKRSKVDPNGKWYCTDADLGSGLECFRDLSNPLVSTAGVLPELYKDFGYKDFSTTPLSGCTDAANNDRCGVHLNSTIVSHWGYLLGVGPVPGQAVPCKIKVTPLDPDPNKSLAMVVNIALLAVGTRTGLAPDGLSAFANFPDFRDATLQVAEELVAQGTIPADAVAKIEIAWAAVGLPPLSLHSTASAPSNTPNIYPWTTFSWPLDGEGQKATSWDFQITTKGTFDAASLAYSKDGISAVGPDGATAVLPLSLPYNTLDTYYWRVRPNTSSGLAWQTCYPIHSFAYTSEPDALNDLHTVADLEPGTGKVLPGHFQIAWDLVRGTDTPNFQTWIGKSNPGCPAGDSPTRLPRSGMPQSDGQTLTESVAFVAQPSTHYFMNVQPVGPPGFDNAKRLGNCATLEFDTAALRPPTTSDIGTQAFTLPNHLAVFNWKTSGGAVKSLVNIYARDAAGNCAAAPTGEPIEVTNCVQDNCDLALTTELGLAGLPNYSGFCWDVVAVAANDARSAPSTKKHVLFEAFTLEPAPGALWSDVWSRYTPGSLGDDSYDKKVKFSWTTLPNFPSAPAYGFKLGRWFWPETLSAPEPKTCVDGNPTLDVCMHGPTAETRFVTTVRGANQLEVAKETAGRGRYCWGVWPIFDDPSHPGQENAVQPQIDYQLECYTTGPAEPRIIVPDGLHSTDPDVPPTGFPQGPITGEVQLDYIPDFQMKGHVFRNGAEISQFDASQCAIDDSSGIYKDVYGCSIPFSFTPLEGATYEIQVETFNSDDYDYTNNAWNPVMDDDTRVHNTKLPIAVAACGDLNQSCCPQSSCDQGICKSGKCVESVAKITSPTGNVTVPTGNQFDFLFEIEPLRHWCPSRLLTARESWLWTRLRRTQV